MQDKHGEAAAQPAAEAASEGLAELTQSLKRKSHKKAAAANPGGDGLQQYLAVPGKTAEGAGQHAAKAGSVKAKSAEGMKPSKVKKAKLAQ